MIIETEVLKCLMAAEINDVNGKVYCERPQNKDENYILIQKTGSGETDHVRRAMIAVQSISTDSLIKAAEINENVINALLTMPEEYDVFSVKLNSDYNYTNTETLEYRYQAVFDIFY